jgi:hypothetical protein
MNVRQLINLLKNRQKEIKKLHDAPKVLKQVRTRVIVDIQTHIHKKVKDFKNHHIESAEYKEKYREFNDEVEVEINTIKQCEDNDSEDNNNLNSLMRSLGFSEKLSDLYNICFNEALSKIPRPCFIREDKQNTNMENKATIREDNSLHHVSAESLVTKKINIFRTEKEVVFRSVKSISVVSSSHGCRFSLSNANATDSIGIKDDFFYKEAGIKDLEPLLVLSSASYDIAKLRSIGAIIGVKPVEVCSHEWTDTYSMIIKGEANVWQVLFKLSFLLTAEQNQLLRQQMAKIVFRPKVDEKLGAPKYCEKVVLAHFVDDSKPYKSFMHRLFAIKSKTLSTKMLPKDLAREVSKFLTVEDSIVFSTVNKQTYNKSLL